LTQKYEHLQNKIAALLSQQEENGWNLIVHNAQGEAKNKIFNSNFLNFFLTLIEFFSDKNLLEKPSPLVFIGTEESYLIPILFMQKEKFKLSSIQIFN